MLANKRPIQNKGFRGNTTQSGAVMFHKVNYTADMFAYSNEEYFTENAATKNSKKIKKTEKTTKK